MAYTCHWATTAVLTLRVSHFLMAVLGGQARKLRAVYNLGNRIRLTINEPERANSSTSG